MKYLVCINGIEKFALKTKKEAEIKKQELIKRGFQYVSILKI